jgi:hypothetical protein
MEERAERTQVVTVDHSIRLSRCVTQSQRQARILKP